VQGTPEGMFGAHSHTGNILTTVEYSAGDFTHWDVKEPVPNQMTVDRLEQTDLFKAVDQVYHGRPD